MTGRKFELSVKQQGFGGKMPWQCVLRVLIVAADHAVTLKLEDLVLRFSRKEKIINTTPISFSFRQGEKTAILSANRRIRDKLLGSIYGLEQPATGSITHKGLVSWP